MKSDSKKEKFHAMMNRKFILQLKSWNYVRIGKGIASRCMIKQHGIAFMIYLYATRHDREE